MHYYNIRVYVPYDGHKDLTIAHEKEFDDLEFHAIIHDVIDETILDHIERSKDTYYCHMDYWNLFGRHNKYRLGLFLKNKGFEVIYPQETVVIQDRPILSDKRYKDIEVSACEGRCFKDDDEECPIVCKRIKNTDDMEE